MTGRIFVVVDVAEVTPLVTALGLGVIAAARHSIDGSKIILDYNHSTATIVGLFLSDPSEYLSSLVVLSHAEGLALMTTTEWLPEQTDAV